MRFVSAFPYIAAVGVRCTPTIERPTLRASSVALCLRVKGQWLSRESNPNASHSSEGRLKADTRTRMPSADQQTLIVPTRRTTSVVDRATTGLPPDLLGRAATRLQILAWLYAFTFFMAGYLSQMLIPGAWDFLVARAINWVPGVISIAAAVIVALAIRVIPLRPAVVTAIALIFEIVGSYGIAAAEFLHPLGITGESWIGLSWVAVWMLLFNVVVPTAPRVTLIAALLSVTSVPVMVLLSLWMFPLEVRPSAVQVFFAFGFPYVLVVIMAYVGARIVYTLGTEVTRLVVHYALHDLGLQRVHLDVLDFNQRAISCYLNAGFHVVGRKPSDVVVEGRLVDDVAMEITAPI